MKLAWIIAGSLALPASSQPEVGYHIGNSLTWDSLPEIQGEFALDQGLSLTTGHHINCNRSLDQIAANPTQTCVPPVPEFGYFEDALADIALDYFTVQPYWTATSTMATDEQVITDMEALLSTNPDSDNAIVYLYQAWGAEYFMISGDWFTPISDSDTTPSTPADEYFIHLFNRIEAALPDREVRIIPVGRVINEIQQQIEADQMPGVTELSEFYRDDIHMSHTIGRFTAAITTAAVLLDRPPYGMHNTWFQFHTDGGYDVATYVAIEDAVWEIISNDPRTGVKPCLGDTNRDGMISPTDFTAWLAAYAAQRTVADQNRDGMVSPTDFTAWLAAYSAGCPE